MMTILQLRQSQIPGLPFIMGRGYEAGEVKITDHEGRYLIAPTEIFLREDNELLAMFNAMLGMARLKGFTHLMLIYGA